MNKLNEILNIHIDSGEQSQIEAIANIHNKLKTASEALTEITNANTTLNTNILDLENKAKQSLLEITNLNNTISKQSSQIETLTNQVNEFKEEKEKALAEIANQKAEAVIEKYVTAEKIADVEEIKNVWRKKLVDDFEGTNALLETIHTDMKAPVAVSIEDIKNLSAEEIEDMDEKVHADRREEARKSRKEKESV